MGKLRNPRQERFAACLAAGRAPVTAWKAAGYQAGAGVRARAARLAGSERVQARVDALRAAGTPAAADPAPAVSKAKKRGMRRPADGTGPVGTVPPVPGGVALGVPDRGWVIARLVQAVEGALARPGEPARTADAARLAGVALRALELLGRELGMFAERKEGGRPLEDLPEAELDRLIRAHGEELGLWAVGEDGGKGDGSGDGGGSSD